MIDKDMSSEGYERLAEILREAFNQSARGKGARRHSNGKPWLDQPILANARQVGPGGPAFQVMKKVQESIGMAQRGEFAGAKAEALGAIVYAAALYQIYCEQEAGQAQ